MTTTNRVTLELLEGPEWFGPSSGDEWEHHAYRVRLSYEGRTMDIPWKQGIGITDDPDACTVLECVLSDAIGVWNAQDFEGWCDDYGFDTDSRRAERIYNQTKEQTEKLRELLGDDFDSAVFPNDEFDTETIARRIALGTFEREG